LPFLHDGYNKKNGLFVECNRFDENSVQGKYCKIDLEPIQSNSTFLKTAHDFLVDIGKKSSIGICSPKVCSVEQVTHIARKVLPEAGYKLNYVQCPEPPILASFDFFVM
jgi:hypothetical protein